MAPGLLLAAFFGALVQRISGLGFGIAVSGFSLAVYDPFTAVYMSAIIGLGVAVITTIQMWRHVVWSVVWPPVLPIVLFMLIGFTLAYWTGGQPLVRAGFQTLGLFSIALVLKTYVFPRVRTQTPSQDPSQTRAQNPAIAHPWIGGSLTGFLSGTVGAPGPTITPYFTARNIVGAAFVASITPVFALTAATRIAIGSGTGFSQQDLHIALLGAVLAVAGVFVGAQIAPHISNQRQRQLIVGLIVLSGIRLTYALTSGLWDYFREASIA